MSDSLSPFMIRPATNADVPAIRRVVFSVLEEYGLQPDHGGTDADLDDVEATYIRRGGAFEVVQGADGAIVGTVGLCPVDSRRAELRKMYLVPSARGRGLGKRLLERMLEHARKMGVREVWLETHSVLREAVSLYRKYGFRPAEREEMSPRCNEVYCLRLD